MVIDMASVFAERYKANPQVLQAAVLGQGGPGGPDAYTALRALQLLKESQRMQMAQAAQGPTASPSLVDQAFTSPQPPQMAGLQAAAQASVPQQGPQAPQMPQPGMDRGLGGMPAGQQNFAPGGIVAFSGDDEEQGQLVDDFTSQMFSSPGNPTQYAQAQTDLNAIMQRVLSDPKVQTMNPEQRKAFIANYMQELQASGGESPYGPMREDIAAARGESARNLEQAKGIALLEAAQAASQPGGTVRGLAAAAGAFGSSYGKALQADRSEKRNLANMQFQLADAERKERMGLHREARMAADAADKSAVEAAKDARTRDIEAAKIKVGELRATRPLAPKAPAQVKLNEQLGAAEIEYEKNPTDENAMRVKALRRAVAQTKDVGPARAGLGEAGIQERIDAKVSTALEEWKLMDKAYRAAQRKGDRTEMDRLETEQEARFRRRFSSPSASSAPSTSTARTTTPPLPAGFVADNQ